MRLNDLTYFDNQCEYIDISLQIHKSWPSEKRYSVHIDVGEITTTEKHLLSSHPLFTKRHSMHFQRLHTP